MLDHLDQPQAATDRRMLAALSRQVTHLALARERYANVRTEVAVPRRSPKAMLEVEPFLASLPIFRYASH
jgi:hypothetical protein